MRRTFIMLFVLLTTTGLPCLVSYILFPIFQPMYRIQYKVSVKLWKLFFCNCLTVCTRFLFVHLSIDRVSIQQKSFLFRIKYTLDSAICHQLCRYYKLREVYLSSISMFSFEILLLPVGDTDRSYFAAPLKYSVPV